MTEKKIRINIKVDEDTPETRHAFADDREECFSLTHLTSLAVEHEIKEQICNTTL